MTRPIIKTPRGKVFINKKTLKAELVWNTNFQPKWQSRFSEGQKWLDNEVLENCEKFTPMLTGMLIKSGDLGTIIGSGEVEWIAPYARYQYYGSRKPGSTTGPLRGPYWFERAKEIYRTHWINGARKIAGGRGK